jgi:hypothetical protein
MERTWFIAHAMRYGSSLHGQVVLSPAREGMNDNTRLCLLVITTVKRKAKSDKCTILQ